MFEIIFEEERCLFNNDTAELIYCKPITLQFEHSLISISKWEERYKKTFLDEDYNKTEDEIMYYLWCMSIKTIDYKYILALNEDERLALINYTNEKRTATVVPHKQEHISIKETITSELIYFWMIEYHIPYEARTWNITRLMALIDICQYKKSPSEKKTEAEIASEYSSENARRKEELKKRGLL